MLNCTRCSLLRVIALLDEDRAGVQGNEEAFFSLDPRV